MVLEKTLESPLDSKKIKSDAGKDPKVSTQVHWDPREDTLLTTGLPRVRLGRKEPHSPFQGFTEELGRPEFLAARFELLEQGLAHRGSWPLSARAPRRSLEMGGGQRWRQSFGLLDPQELCWL